MGRKPRKNAGSAPSRLWEYAPGLRRDGYLDVVLVVDRFYAWKKRFEEEELGGLLDRPRGTVKGSKLPDLTKRAILMMKEASVQIKSDAPKAAVLVSTLTTE